MMYREMCGHKVSLLGFGAMRLPVIDGQEACVDEQATLDMVDYAFEQGINYFDTAYGYHEGNSQKVMGKALARYPRDSFYLATKFPGYDTGNFGKVEQIFEDQLAACGVDYFDFYLLHNVCELNVDQYLDDETYGTVSYLLEQKAAGRIGHLGFSVHGTQETFMRLLDAYGEHMEFCQIQLNYMDWSFQDARAKVAVLNERNIPIVVMEPLRGGDLISLPAEDVAALEKLRPGKSAVDWAFRYVQDVPGVACVLSGMSHMDQLVENAKIFEAADTLSDDQVAALYKIAADKVAKTALPCTKCRYCTSYCPQELDIPRLIELYNEHCSREGFAFIAPMALGAMPPEKHPSACIGCGACADVCPQRIDIPGAFADFAERLKA